MWVVGQKPQSINGQTLFGGNLTVVNLANNTISSSAAVSDGQPGAMSRILQADDNTLWIAMTNCTTGVRYATNPTSGYGCLTCLLYTSQARGQDPAAARRCGPARAVTGPRGAGWLCYTSLVITCVEIAFGLCNLNDFRVHALPFLCRGGLRRSINRGLGF